MTIDYGKIVPLHLAVQNKPKEWRLGQAYFNYAYQMYPKESDKLRGTNKDCFYHDELMPVFLEELDKLILTKE